MGIGMLHLAVLGVCYQAAEGQRSASELLLPKETIILVI